MARITTFLLVVTVVLILTSLYVGLRWCAESETLKKRRKTVWLGLALFVCLQFLGPLTYRALPTTSNFSFIMQWVTYTTLGVFSCLFIYTLMSDLIIGVVRLGSRGKIDLGKRAFLGVGAASAITAGVGGFQALRSVARYDVEIPIQNLPPELEGFRIGQISDLHVGPTIRRNFVQQVVNQVNEMQADLVALTGDLLDGSIPQLGDSIAPLGQLRSRLGSFFVTGNHEYYWGHSAWLKHFEEMGIQILNNENRKLVEASRPLYLAGIPDPQGASIGGPSHQVDFAKAFGGVPAHAVKILLAHRPQVFKEAAAAGVDLQLSGHTHGGQYFPWSLFVAAVYRFYKGLGRYHKTWIYVSRGTGYWGPPLRFTVPSEVTLLVLKKA